MSISLSSGARELQRFAIPIPVHYIYKMPNLWSPLAPLLRKIDICVRSIETFEMWYCKRMLHIKRTDKIRNEEV